MSVCVLVVCGAAVLGPPVHFVSLLSLVIVLFSPLLSPRQRCGSMAGTEKGDHGRIRGIRSVEWWEADRREERSHREEQKRHTPR